MKISVYSSSLHHDDDGNDDGNGDGNGDGDGDN